MRRLVEDEVRSARAREREAPPADFDERAPVARRAARSSEPVELTCRETHGAGSRTPRTASARPYSRRSERVDVAARLEHDLGRRRHRPARPDGRRRPAEDDERVHPGLEPRRARTHGRGSSSPASTSRRPRDRSHYERFARLPRELLPLGRGDERDAVLAARARPRARGRAGGDGAPRRPRDGAAARRDADRRPPRASSSGRSRRWPGARRAAGRRGRGARERRRGRARRARRRLGQQGRRRPREAAASSAATRRSTATRRGSPRHAARRRGAAASTSPTPKFAAPTSMRDVEPSVHLWLRSRSGGRRYEATPLAQVQGGSRRTARRAEPAGHDLRRRRDDRPGRPRGRSSVGSTSGATPGRAAADPRAAAGGDASSAVPRSSARR